MQSLAKSHLSLCLLMNCDSMEKFILLFCLLLIFGFLIDEYQCWWDTRRRRRRCTASDCILAAWSSWGACSQTCGNGGMQERQRRIVKAQSCGGICFKFRETRPCNNGCCPVDCVSSWSNWGACQGTCGQGLRSRNSTIESIDRCGGAPCPRNRTESQSCSLARYATINRFFLFTLRLKMTCDKPIVLYMGDCNYENDFINGLMGRRVEKRMDGQTGV